MTLENKIISLISENNAHYTGTQNILSDQSQRISDNAIDIAGFKTSHRRYDYVVRSKAELNRAENSIITKKSNGSLSTLARPSIYIESIEISSTVNLISSHTDYYFSNLIVFEGRHWPYIDIKENYIGIYNGVFYVPSDIERKQAIAISCKKSLKGNFSIDAIFYNNADVSGDINLKNMVLLEL